VGEEAVVALDSAMLRRIGLRTVTLTSTTRPQELELPAVIVSDPGAGTTIRAGMGGRLAEAQGHLWPRIGQYLEAGTEIAQVGDARPVSVPRGGTVTRILAQPGELVQPGQPLLELMDYAVPIARVAWTIGEATPPAGAAFTPLGGGKRQAGKLQGPAPEADPVTGGPSFLYRLGPGGAALRPGAALIASIPDPEGSRRGVEVPNAAVVQWDALGWVYVERAPGKFARVRVPTDHPVPGGWRVDRGLAPGDRVVTTGAGQLLSEEFRARIVVGEEVGE
jgi:multidrug efflux pump subunit AcrA (membrane-fusion protein)